MHIHLRDLAYAISHPGLDLFSIEPVVVESFLDQWPERDAPKNPQRLICRQLLKAQVVDDEVAKHHFPDGDISRTSYVATTHWIFAVTRCGRAYRICGVQCMTSDDNKKIGHHNEISSEQLFFTTHALDQFTRRYGGKIKNVERTAREIFTQAKEERAIGSVERVKRLINNEFVAVRYFLKMPWRFVLKELADGKFLVLTIEIAHVR